MASVQREASHDHRVMRDGEVERMSAVGSHGGPRLSTVERAELRFVVLFIERSEISMAFCTSWKEQMMARARGVSRRTSAKHR